MDEMSQADLDAIEHRARAAFGVMPLPWTPYLESRHGIGGCSFVQCTDTDTDYEIYFDVHIGNEPLRSPDATLDAVIDFIGNAAADIPCLVAEVRRLRAITGTQ
jgi:hypothetical protein